MSRWALALLLLAGCGGKKSSSFGDGGVMRATNIPAVHLSSCDDPTCGNGDNPPLGGDHCGTAVSCRKFDAPQLRCQWLHNLEHGHAVLAYNCPEGCPQIVEQLTAIWDARQGDAKKKRLLVTPDARLPRKVVAVVWGFGWTGDQVDAAAIDEVLSHQDAEAPEPFLGCAP